MHRAALPGMCDEQASKPDADEEGNHEREVPHIVDEQQIAPVGAAAVEVLFKPKKNQCDHREDEQYTACVIAWPFGAAGDESTVHHEDPEDQELQPKAEPGPKTACRFV